MKDRTTLFCYRFLYDIRVIVWNLATISHHEEEAPKNESHKQEEHKMTKKTITVWIEFQQQLGNWWGKRGIMRTNVVHSGETSADTKISKGDNSGLIGLTSYKVIADASRITKCSENKL